MYISGVESVVNARFILFQIEELADIYSFVYQTIGLQWKD